MLGGDLVGLAEIALGNFADLCRKLFAARVDFQLPRLFGRALGELDDGVEHRLEMLLAEHHGAKHHILCELLGFGLDHQHGVGGAGDHEVERAFAHLVDHRVQRVFAADIADARGADRAQEGNAGQRERGGGRDHGDDVGIVLHVMGEHGGDDLRLVAEARLRTAA